MPSALPWIIVGVFGAGVAAFSLFAAYQRGHSQWWIGVGIGSILLVIGTGQVLSAKLPGGGAVELRDGSPAQQVGPAISDRAKPSKPSSPAPVDQSSNVVPPAKVKAAQSIVRSPLLSKPPPNFVASPPAPNPIHLEGAPTRLPEVWSNPVLLEQPKNDDLEKIYPMYAGRLDCDGSAEVTCSVGIDGHLSGCEVTNESPKGWGFGQAAIEASAYFHVRPMMKNGIPVAGGSLTKRVTFRTGERNAETQKLCDPAGPAAVIKSMTKPNS